MSRESILRQGFDVLKLENKLYREASYHPYYEATNYYDYTKGVYVYTITANDVNIGEYRRDYIGQGWVATAFFGREKKRQFATDKSAVRFIQRQYVRNREV